jgi:hypothetical protein
MMHPLVALLAIFYNFVSRRGAEEAEFAEKALKPSTFASSALSAPLRETFLRLAAQGVLHD